ncbi:proton-conducting transporter membrane subunit [Sphingomonas mollis]|uniref:NADH:quinone oxidoreductase/Mrp antiporter transmembrane domain-containing protein n=1 Tax=Sphingomonas mollis TaxID=2795726 RepID=A0ABS0XK50_9SPHN|nr:proton-conducting transporter membrane subunit [Sphingomonas sp. BT553]MBJ6120417.1 hypothetical protein [Sphingomonas sp. BT553]
MGDPLVLLAPVGIPLLGVAVTALLRTRPRACEALGFVSVAATLIAAIALIRRAIDGGPAALVVFGGWPQAIGIAFAARLPGPALVVVASIIALAVALYGHADIGPRRRRRGYDAMSLAMLAAVNGAFLTTDLFNLYVWFELALLAALGLITIDRREAQIGGAIRYAAFGMVGATAVLAGIGIIYGVAGTLDLETLATQLGSGPPSVAVAAAGTLLLCGFALKSGLFPFHAWLPASYASAPLPAAAAFAGLLTKMGFYALLVIVAGVFGGIGATTAVSPPLLTTIGVMAAATMILCALSALAQSDIRRILGYQVVAQVGYMAAGLAIGTRDGVAGAVFYMVHSMILQANLFLGAGAIRRATGSWDLTRAGGMTRSNPLFAFLFAVPILSLAGIPPLSGFWAKLLVIRAAFDGGSAWIAAAALVAAMLTIVSMATIWSEACWKSLSGRRVRKVPGAMLAGMAVLSAVTLAIGLMPEPLLRIARLSADALGGTGS